MKKIFSLSLGLLILTGLPGCGGTKPVVIQPEPEAVQEVQEAKQMKPQPIKQARTSGPIQKEVGWEEEDYS